MQPPFLLYWSWDYWSEHGFVFQFLEALNLLLLIKYEDMESVLSAIKKGCYVRNSTERHGPWHPKISWCKGSAFWTMYDFSSGGKARHEVAMEIWLFPGLPLTYMCQKLTQSRNFVSAFQLYRELWVIPRNLLPSEDSVMKQLHLEFWFLPNTVSGTGTTGWGEPSLFKAPTLLQWEERRACCGGTQCYCEGRHRDLWGSLHMCQLPSPAQQSHPQTAVGCRGQNGCPWKSMHFRCQQCWRY